jgi:hypothetical protein
MNLSRCVNFIRVLAAQAVGTASETSTIIDMQNYEGVVAILAMGTLTDGTPLLKAQGGNLANGSDMADLANTHTSALLTDDGKALVLDIYRPEFRYIQFVAVRGGTTGAVWDAMIAAQYCAKVVPTPQDTSISNINFVASPPYGTA